MRKKVINVKRYILVAFAVCCVLVNMPPRDALAVDLGPTGMITDATPLTPGVTFTDNTVDLVTINTTELQTTIEYTDFNINTDWTVHFQQPDGGNTLNQILGGSPSDIFGTLTSNGGVYIVNPAGVIFHGGSSVNVPRLVASSLWMEKDDFTNGTNFFSGTGPVEGGIGVIEVEDGAIIGDTLKPELVALIGQKVVNSGIIETQTGGLVLLATGDSVLFRTDPGNGDILVQLDIDAVTNANPDVPDWANVVNTETGKITSPEGQIVLAAGDGFAAVLGSPAPLSVPAESRVKQYGTIDADAVDGSDGDGGSIMMRALTEVATFQGSSTTTFGDGEGKGGPIEIYSQGGVRIQEDLTSGGDMIIDAKTSVYVGAEDSSGDPVKKNLNAEGGTLDVSSEQKKVYLSGNVESELDMNLHAGESVTIMGDAESRKGSISITGGSGVSYASGDITAEQNVNVGRNDLDTTDLRLMGGKWVHDEDNDLWFWDGDQHITATTGTVTTYGQIIKKRPGELHITGGSSGTAVDLNPGEVGFAASARDNIYIEGEGDIQIGGDITAMGDGYGPFPAGPDMSEHEAPVYYPETVGGVSIISKAGKIYTKGASVENALDVSITGYSDDITIPDDNPYGSIGVDLPYKDGDEVLGKAAIVLVSHNTLKLGEKTYLDAYGVYLAADPDVQDNGDFVGVDDRPGINFLDEDAVIGGYDRDQGIPSDVAIYAASTKGDVEVDTQYVWVNSGITINTSVRDNGYHGNPTVVFDAYNTVRFPFLDRLKYIEGFWWFRLEVCSRITEWLYQAIAWERLPFADAPELMEEFLDNDYVLRGAGGFPHPDPEAPDLWTERAWVLEDPPPSFVEAAPLPILELPELKGCPVELEAAAAEVGLGPEELQLLVGNSLAANPNIQPCDACASLVESARILQDADGAYMAAMNNVFNSIAPANMPFSPETETLIVTAFSRMSDEQPRYAAAMEYIDAFVNYIAVLDTELGSPVEDSAAYALAKYGSPVTDNPNGNMTAYVMSRVEGIGG